MEIARTIRRILYFQLAVGLVALVVAYSPDSALIPSDRTLQLPGVDTAMTIRSFMIFGPISLLLINLYLQFFLQSYAYHVVPNRHEFLFTMPGYFANIVSDVLLYWFTPVTLVAICWRMLPRPEVALLAMAALLYFLLLWALHVNRQARYRKYNIYVRNFVSVAGIAATGILALQPEFILAMRKLELTNADLRGRNLDGVNLFGAVMNGVRLENAHLKNAVLSKASLIGSTLSETRLISAQLTEAKITDSCLKNTKFSEIDEPCTGSSPKGCAKLTSVDFSDSDIRGIHFNHHDLSDSKFVSAFIMVTEFSHAVLKNAKLQNAFLWSVNLVGADIERADFRGVKGLDCDILKKAKNWEAAFRDDLLACGGEIPTAKGPVIQPSLWLDLDEASQAREIQNALAGSICR